MKRITLIGRPVKEWDDWLKNELVEDGTLSRVLHEPDPKDRRDVYQHVVKGFREALRLLQGAK